LAFNRFVIVALGRDNEAATIVYLLRFAAFSLIIWGIVRQNTGAVRSGAVRRRRQAGSDTD
jgi:hypothetical protein